MFRLNLKLVASHVPDIIAIGALGGGSGFANPQSWGRGGRSVGGRGWYRSKERW